MNVYKPLILLLILMSTMGCAESAILAGNGLSMVVTCVLLWSTVNINRPDDDKE